MLDVLLMLAALLLTLALRAVRRGDHRLHAHLMIAACTVVALRLWLHSNGLTKVQLSLWLAALAAAGITMLLGRMALAWREARSTHAAIPRLHRFLGTLTIIGLALTTLAWLLRQRG